MNVDAPDQPASRLWISRTAAAATRTLLGLLLLAWWRSTCSTRCAAMCSAWCSSAPTRCWCSRMIWMVMIGMILVTADRRHIALDFLVSRAADRARASLLAILHNVDHDAAACAYAASSAGPSSSARRRDRADQHGARHPDGDPAFRAGGRASPARRIAAALLVIGDGASACACVGARAAKPRMIWTLAVLPVVLLLLGTPIFALFLAGAIADVRRSSCRCRRSRCTRSCSAGWRTTRCSRFRSSSSPAS